MRWKIKRERERERERGRENKREGMGEIKWEIKFRRFEIELNISKQKYYIYTYIDIYTQEYVSEAS